MTDFETRPRGPLKLQLEPWAAELRGDVVEILRDAGRPLSMFAIAEALERRGRVILDGTGEARLYRAHPVNVQLGRLCLALHAEGALAFMDPSPAIVAGPARIEAAPAALPSPAAGASPAALPSPAPRDRHEAHWAAPAPPASDGVLDTIAAELLRAAELWIERPGGAHETKCLETAARAAALNPLPRQLYRQLATAAARALRAPTGELATAGLRELVAAIKRDSGA